MDAFEASGGGGAGGVVFTSLTVIAGTIYNGLLKYSYIAIIHCFFLRRTFLCMYIF